MAIAVATRTSSAFLSRLCTRTAFSVDRCQLCWRVMPFRLASTTPTCNQHCTKKGKYKEVEQQVAIISPTANTSVSPNWDGESPVLRALASTWKPLKQPLEVGFRSPQDPLLLSEEDLETARKLGVEAGQFISRMNQPVWTTEPSLKGRPKTPIEIDTPRVLDRKLFTTDCLKAVLAEKTMSYQRLILLLELFEACADQKFDLSYDVIQTVLQRAEECGVHEVDLVLRFYKGFKAQLIIKKFPLILPIRCHLPKRKDTGGVLIKSSFFKTTVMEGLLENFKTLEVLDAVINAYTTFVHEQLYDDASDWEAVRNAIDILYGLIASVRNGISSRKDAGLLVDCLWELCTLEVLLSTHRNDVFQLLINLAPLALLADRVDFAISIYKVIIKYRLVPRADVMDLLTRVVNSGSEDQFLDTMAVVCMNNIIGLDKAIMTTIVRRFPKHSVMTALYMLVQARDRQLSGDKYRKKDLLGVWRVVRNMYFHECESNMDFF